MKTPFSLLIISLINIYSCSKIGDPISTDVDFNQLSNFWVLASDESQLDGKNQIYRPKNYHSSSTGFLTDSLQFFPGGNCKFFVFHPADAHYMEIGNWGFDSNKINTIQITRLTGEVYRKFEVLELNSKILKINELK